MSDYQNTLDHAVHLLKNNEVIAYPTEAVYGLGCDPFSLVAVEKICEIKQREAKKGLILVASHWHQIESLIDPIDASVRQRVEATWPGAITWVFPASRKTPAWIRGFYRSVAIRISAHPLVYDLCRLWGKPIVSTSANRSGFPPIRDPKILKEHFGEQLACIIPGELGDRANPTPIVDAMTGRMLRGN